MADLQPLNEDERAELIAYLDGELDDVSASAVEARINRDPRVRAEADSLRRAWNLLDYLPRPEPSPQFTQRTLTRATVLVPSFFDRARKWRRVLFGVGWAAAVIVAALVGYAAVPGAKEPPAAPKPDDAEQQLVRDLRVIDRLPAYQDAGDINFLHELDRPELFGDDASGR
jgi:anti-sigma factor RsiW